jgi:hypothetical protein
MLIFWRFNKYMSYINNENLLCFLFGENLAFSFDF